MNRFRILSIRRNQLAEFLPDQKSIKEFERLFTQDNELAETVSNIIIAAGIDDEGNYIIPTGSNFIDSADSLYSADLFLDNAIFDETRTFINTIIGDVSLIAGNLLVLADASSGAINVTLPDPALCFSDNRSFMIGVTKIDSSTNTITILPYASETIVGESSQALLLDGEVLNFISDGINWQIVN